jgi:MFS family permease
LGLRARLSLHAARLSAHELELSYAVEAAEDIGLLIPSLSVDSYHRVLSDACEMSSRSATVSRMLSRLRNSLETEIAAVSSLERRSDELRRARWSAVAGLFASLAIPLTILFGYFSAIGGTRDKNLIFDWRAFAIIYAIVGGLIAVSLIVLAVLYVMEARRLRREFPPRG